MININEVKELVKSGRFFSAIFTKKDNTERKMVARIGVKKGVKGVGRKFDPTEKGLISVWDVNAGDFRLVNVNTCKQLRIDGKIFK